MRINVYAEEITQETDIIVKTVNQEQFYGIRLFMKSPQELYHKNSDDDRSAVTLWVPWTKVNGHNPDYVISALMKMVHRLTSYAKVRGDL